MSQIKNEKNNFKKNNSEKKNKFEKSSSEDTDEDDDIEALAKDIGKNLTHDDSGDDLKSKNQIEFPDSFTTPKKLPKSKSAPPTQSVSPASTPLSPRIQQIHSARKLGQDYISAVYLEKLEAKRSEAKRPFSSSYSANHTAALALQPLDKHPREYGMSDAELEQYKDDFKTLLATLEFSANPHKRNSVEDIEDNYVFEHAARRVDLFFYTAVAYYDQHIVPIQDQTIMQHGIGRNSTEETKKKITEGCHSSFFPQLIDQHVFNKVEVKIKGKRSDVSEKNVLFATHFQDSLNATIEMPKFVNELDSLLEGKIEKPSPWRNKALGILHQVSIGKHPIEALFDFLKVMESAFNSAKIIKYSQSSPEKKKVYERQKQGTLKNTITQDGKISLKYIALLLRITPEELKDCKNKQDKWENLLDSRISSLQKEILNTHSSYMKLLPEMTSKKIDRMCAESAEKQDKSDVYRNKTKQEERFNARLESDKKRISSSYQLNQNSIKALIKQREALFKDKKLTVNSKKGLPELTELNKKLAEKLAEEERLLIEIGKL